MWTDNGPDSHNQPDPGAIAEACLNGETTNGEKCHPYCPKNDGVCIKMTYTVRDGSGTVNYMSRSVKGCCIILGLMLTNFQQIFALL